jgi:hypothetical protein
MSDEYERSLDPRRQQALTELRGMIARRYPTAAFDIGPGEEDPQVTHLTTSVDLDDPDEVADLVMERMLALQLDEGIPVYVIPIRTPERVARLRREQGRRNIPGVPVLSRRPA